MRLTVFRWDLELSVEALILGGFSSLERKVGGARLCWFPQSKTCFCQHLFLDVDVQLTSLQASM